MTMINKNKVAKINKIQISKRKRVIKRSLLLSFLLDGRKRAEAESRLCTLFFKVRYDMQVLDLHILWSQGRP